MYLLREYRRVAHVQHWCDMCCRYIEPGEYYEGMVTVYYSPHRLVVFKVHLNPGCDFPPNPDEEIGDVVFEDFPWKLAA